MGPFEKDLVDAVLARDACRVTQALQIGANPNTRCLGTTYKAAPVLIYAVIKEDLQVVTALLESQTIEVDLRGDAKCTALMNAVIKANAAIVQLLISRGAEVDLSSGEDPVHTPLFEAVLRDDCSMAELLLNNNASPDQASGQNSQTPLLAAVGAGSDKMATLLLQHNASVDLHAGAATSHTPLYESVLRGKYSLVELLLKSGASPDLPSGHFDTPPLVQATSGAHLDICRLLLDYNANPNATDRRGNHSIYTSASQDDRDIVKLIMDYGGNPHLPRDCSGHTAVDIARENGYKDTAKWLKKQRDLYRHEAKDVGPHGIYPNESGLVYFFNYIRFTDPKRYREGAEKDEINIKSTFKDLHYRVEYYEDLSNAETISILKNLRKNQRLWYVDSLIIIISTHGMGPMTFLTSDGGELNINKIKTFFTDTKCPQMKNKPKVLINNGCRGGLEEKMPDYVYQDMETLTMDDAELFHSRRHLKVELPKHMGMIFSTSEGIRSMRNKETGSFFIQYLCEALRNGPDEELNVVINTIADKMIKERLHHPTALYEYPFRKFTFKLERSKKKVFSFF